MGGRGRAGGPGRSPLRHPGGTGTEPDQEHHRAGAQPVGEDPAGGKPAGPAGGGGRRDGHGGQRRHRHASRRLQAGGLRRDRLPGLRRAGRRCRHRQLPRRGHRAAVPAGGQLPGRCRGGRVGGRARATSRRRRAGRCRPTATSYSKVRASTTKATSRGRESPSSHRRCWVPNRPAPTSATSPTTHGGSAAHYASLVHTRYIPID